MTDLIVWIIWNKIMDLTSLMSLIAIIIGVIIIIWGIADNTVEKQHDHILYVDQNKIEQFLLIFKKTKSEIREYGIDRIRYYYKVLFGKKYFIDCCEEPPEHINCRCTIVPPKY